MMSAIEAIFSYSSLEHRFRHIAQTQIENLSEFIVSTAHEVSKLLNALQEFLKEEKFYFYYDGQDWIPLPELSKHSHTPSLEHFDYATSLIKYLI